MSTKSILHDAKRYAWLCGQRKNVAERNYAAAVREADHRAGEAHQARAAAHDASARLKDRVDKFMAAPAQALVDGAGAHETFIAHLTQKKQSCDDALMQAQQRLSDAQTEKDTAARGLKRQTAIADRASGRLHEAAAQLERQLERRRLDDQSSAQLAAGVLRLRRFCP